MTLQTEILSTEISDFLRQIIFLKSFNSMFNIYLLVLTASAATLINIKNARKHFEKLERVDQGSNALTA